jgi:uncharacterized protein YbjT (DUF2867 family)
MITVAGATGALGSRVCRELLGRGVSVNALTRDPSSARAKALERDGARVVSGDLERRIGLDVAVAGASCAVSTATAFPLDQRPQAIDAVDLAGNMAMVDACVAAGVPRFVFVSFRPVPYSFPLQDAKRAVERRLAEVPMDAVILRPGKLMDIWFSPLCGFDAVARHATVFGDGTSPLSWISARDVGEIVARCALGESDAAGTLELGGPEALTQREVIAIYERTIGAPFRIERITVEQLEHTLAEDHDPIAVSLAALMLESHCGAVTDMAPVLDLLPLELETVEQFARRRAGPS